MDRTRQRRKMHIAGLLAFLLLATAMLSLRLFDGGAASGTVNVGGMFTYETGFSAGARAATAANGLPAYLTDGNMQTYPGSSLGASYSYANAGAYVTLSKAGGSNTNTTLITRNFQLSDNTADTLLLRFIPAPADNVYQLYQGSAAPTEEKTAAELWNSGQYTRLRVITIRIIDAYDEDNYITVRYSVRQGENAAYEFCRFDVFAPGQAAGAQRGDQGGGALNTVGGALVPDIFWSKWNEPAELYYDAAENKMYAKITNLSGSLSAAESGKQLVRDFGNAYAADPVTWDGFTTGEVRMEISYTGGWATGGILFTDIDGVNLATDDEGNLDPGAVAASADWLAGQPVSVIAGESYTLPTAVRRNFLTDDVTADASELDGYTVAVYDASDEDITQTAVTGLGADNAYTEEAELTVSAVGEYTVVYAKAGSADIVFPLSAVSQTHQKLPDEIFGRKQEGDGLGMAEVTLPVAADGTSTLPLYMSAYDGIGVVYDSDDGVDGATLTKVMAQVPSVNIGDNTKDDSLITLTPMSSDNSDDGKNDGIQLLTVYVYEKTNPANYFTVSLFHYERTSLHATAAGTGQLDFGYRANQALTAQSGNHLLASPGTFGETLYKISYDKTENAVYINGNLVRDFDLSVGAEGDIRTTNAPQERGTAWAGFETDEVSIALYNMTGGGKALITDVDGQSLGYTVSSDGTAVFTSAVKTETFNRTLTAAKGSAVTLDPLTEFNLFDGFTTKSGTYYVKVTDPSGTETALDAATSFMPETTGTYRAVYYADAAYEEEAGHAYVKVYDDSLEAAFTAPDGATVTADGVSTTNNVCASGNTTQNVLAYGVLRGMKLTGGDGAVFTLERTLYLGDNRYTDADNYDTVVELGIAPDYLRFPLYQLHVTLTDPVTGKYVTVTMQNEHPTDDPVQQGVAALNGQSAYLQVNAPNGTGGAQTTGQLRHDNTGYNATSISLRTISMNGRTASTLKIVYDAEENALYAMNPSDASHLTLLRHFSPTAEERETYGYPDDYENWSGFTGGEAILSVRFEMADEDDYRYVVSGRPSEASVIVCSVDGQSLALEDGAYGERKTVLAPADDFTARTGQTVAVPVPQQYSLFVTGGKADFTDFAGTVTVLRGSETVMEETPYSADLSFTPTTAGAYTVRYASGGQVAETNVTVHKTLTVGTVSGGGTVSVAGEPVSAGDSFALTEDTVIGFTADDGYALTAVALNEIDFTEQAKNGSLTLTAASAADSTTLTATFSPVYTLTLRDGDVTLGTLDVVQGETAASPDGSLYPKPGYAFAGWYADAGFAAIFDFETPVSADADVYARYTAIPYTITYEAAGGTLSGEYTESFTVEDDEIVLPAVSRDGYVFDGWYDNVAFNGEAITSGAYTFPAGNLTLYARFSEVKYTVHFVTNGGSDVDDIELSAGLIVIAPEVTRDGYVFDGWYTDEALTERYNFSESISSDLTLYAGWTAEETDPDPVDPGTDDPGTADPAPADDGCGCGGVLGLGTGFGSAAVLLMSGAFLLFRRKHA